MISCARCSKVFERTTARKMQGRGERILSSIYCSTRCRERARAVRTRASRRARGVLTLRRSHRDEPPARRIYVDVAVPVAEMIEQLTRSGFYGTSIARTAEDLLLWAIRMQIRRGRIKVSPELRRMVRRLPE